MTRFSPLATPSATRAALARHGLAAKKALGQNFLIHDAIVGKICELAQVDAGDDVLEVGPGIGTLTVALCARARAVHAIERDRDLAPVLEESCWNFDNFTLHMGDALQVGSDDLGGFAPTKLVANLPYAVAATLVLDVLDRFPSMRSMTVMVQSEVADRMAASPGTKDYAAYSVKLALRAQATGRFEVAPSNFMPAPHVSSAVIRLDRVQDHAPDDVALASVAADAAFAARRKTIANSMKAYFSRPGSRHLEAADVVHALETAGIDARRRGETLSLDEFIALGRACASCGGWE